jgi:hypothetical protein
MRKLSSFGFLGAALLTVLLTMTSGCGTYGGGGGGMYPTPMATRNPTPMHT